MVEIETGKLPEGSVIVDGKPYGTQPPGHVSIKDVKPKTVKEAVKTKITKGGNVKKPNEE